MAACVASEQQPLLADAHRGRVIRTRKSEGGRGAGGPLETGLGALSAARLRIEAGGVFDAVPFTPSQGVCSASPHVMSQTSMFSPFSAGSGFARPAVDTSASAVGGLGSDGSSGSDLTGLAGLPTSPVGSNVGAASSTTGYSPFMGVPWGNSSSLYVPDGPSGPSPLELPTSPMSPGVVFKPNTLSPGAGGGLGAPGSPRSLFNSSHSPTPYGLSSAGMRTTSGSLQLPAAGFAGGANAAAAAAAAADAAAAATAAINAGLPPFYFQAAAAAAGGAAGASSLQAALSQTLLGQHTANLAAAQQQQQQQAAAAAAQQQQQQLLQASLSAALASQAAAAANNPYLQGYPSAVLSALEPMRSAGGSLSLDGGLQQQASVNAAAALLQQQQQMAAVMAAQQQHAAASQLRRNMSTPAGVAAQLGLSSAAAAATASLGLTSASTLASSGSGLPLSAQMGRLHVTHSADLSHLDAAALLGGGAGGMGCRPKFNKARKNSEPKIGPDGQPRLNARQRRTLRRAKERALKGLLEVSQVLLAKAEVQVTVPNISHLTALEELAAVEAEKEAAGGGDAGDGCLSPGGSGGANGARPPSGAASGAGRPAGGVSRSQQLAAAAAAVEESVCEIARAAVAAVTAQATGKDTASAAAAAQAAAAQAASAAASAGAVLPPGYVMPAAEEGAADELQGCSSDPLDSLGSLSHSAPTSPVGSSIAAGDPSSGRSSSSSSSSQPGSARCSSSSAGSVASSYGGGGGAAKPPVCHPPRPASTSAVPGGGSSPLCSPLPSPTPSCGPAPASAPAGAGAAKSGGHLEGIDIAGLIGQLSLKKDEGMVDDKLIRDLQIIQSLIGALKAPSAAPGVDGPPPPSPANGGSASSPGVGPGGRSLRGLGSKSMPSRRCASPSTALQSY